MSHRVVNFVVLATFAFWATGLAHAAHEALEHGGTVAMDAAPVSQAASVDALCAEPYDHGDCPICHLLATMTAAPSAAPVIAVVSAPRPQPAIALCQTIRAAQALGLLPSRGPPPAAHLAA